MTETTAYTPALQGAELAKATNWRETVVASVADALGALKDNDPTTVIRFLSQATGAAVWESMRRSNQ